MVTRDEICVFNKKMSSHINEVREAIEGKIEMLVVKTMQILFVRF